MEFLEGNCPKCNGELKIPGDREEIICMYCGNTIKVKDAVTSTLERQDTDSPDDREQIAEAKAYGIEHISAMILSVKDPLSSFKKSTYEKNFLEYFETHRKCTEAIAELQKQNATDCYEQIAQALIEQVEQNLSTLSHRKTENLMMDYNMIVVVYLIPAMVKCNQKAGTLFAEELLRQWKAHFPKTDLKASTFEEINGGFKKRYCYITTAVCKSLGKPEDCYELTTLRNYRDTYIRKQENGEALVKKYYDVAPSIVKSIDRLPNSEKIYYNIWIKYLSPCISYIEEDKYVDCMKLYTNMVNDLQEKYFIKEI